LRYFQERQREGRFGCTLKMETECHSETFIYNDSDKVASMCERKTWNNMCKLEKTILRNSSNAVPLPQHKCFDLVRYFFKGATMPPFVPRIFLVIPYRVERHLRLGRGAVLPGRRRRNHEFFGNFWEDKARPQPCRRLPSGGHARARACSFPLPVDTA